MDQDGGGVEFAHSDVIDEFSVSVPWKVTAQHALPTKHVNVQETFQVGHRTKHVHEIVSLVARTNVTRNGRNANRLFIYTL